MAENIISFAITNKIHSIPIYKVLSNEGLVILEFILLKNFKGIIGPQFIIKSTNDSLTRLEPMLFKTEIAEPFNKVPIQKTDSLAICFLEDIILDCKKVKIELVVVNPGSIEEGRILYADIRYKTFGGDNTGENNSLPKDPKMKIEHELHMI